MHSVAVNLQACQFWSNMSDTDTLRVARTMTKHMCWVALYLFWCADKLESQSVESKVRRLEVLTNNVTMVMSIQSTQGMIIIYVEKSSSTTAM